MARRATMVARRLRWLGAASLLAAALAIPLFRAGTLQTVGGVQIGAADWVMGDFRSVVYYPAKAFRDGLNPYDAAVYLPRYPVPEPFRAYPPALLLVAQPLAQLPPVSAAAVQLGLTLALTGILAWWSASRSEPPTHSLGILAAAGLILMSRPGHWNLLQGHITLLIVLAVYAALALPPRRYWLGGLALAVAMLKPNFGIPLAVLMLATFRTRSVIVGLGITALLNLPVLAILAKRSGGVVRAVRLMVEGASPEASDLASQYALFRVDASALISRFVGTSLGPVVPVVIAVGVLGIAAVLLRRRARLSASMGTDPVSVGLACTAILLCVYHIGYDLLLLVWPATVLVTGFAARRGSRPPRAWLELALIAVLAGNYLATYAAMEVLGAGSAIGLLALSLNGMAVLILFCLYARDASAQAPTRVLTSDDPVPPPEPRETEPYGTVALLPQ